MNAPSPFPLYDPEELKAQRNQMKWRALIAGLVGLLIMAIFLDVGIQGIRSALSFAQENTTKRIKKIGASLETYHSTHHKYPVSLGELPDWNAPVRDSWGTPLVYQAHGQSYFLRSYGADKQVGGKELDYDISNTNLSPPQARLSSLKVLTHSASWRLELGCLICGCLTAILTFQSIKTQALTGSGWLILLLKVGVIGIAALLTSSVVLTLDIPTGH